MSEASIGNGIGAISDGASDGATLADVAYRMLRDAICSGRIAPNERLAQNSLADQLGISRTPVRDALLRLAQEGLVHSVSWRGYIVNEFTPREIIDIYDARLPLELAGLERAFGRHTARDIAELHDINDAISAGGTSVEQLFELNYRFHTALVVPSENPIFLRLLEQLWQMPVSLRMFYTQYAADTGQGMAAEHARIVDALEAGDREQTLSEARAHIERARQTTVAWLESRPPDPH